MKSASKEIDYSTRARRAGLKFFVGDRVFVESESGDIGGWCVVHRITRKDIVLRPEINSQQNPQRKASDD